MVRFPAGLCALVLAASMGVHGCGNAQEAPAPSRLPVFTEVQGEEPIELKGVIWTGGGTVIGVLDSARHGEDGLIVEAIVSMGSVRASRNSEPIVAFTNTFEVDCDGRRYRKLAETYLSADARPLARAVYNAPNWQEGFYSALERACGDTTVTPNGGAFVGMAEFRRLFDAEASRLGVETRISGPTITLPN